MTAAYVHSFLRQLRRVVGPPSDPDSDGQLLERFRSGRDEAAFAALVQRHGPMVLGTCRRILGHEQDAEDVPRPPFWCWRVEPEPCATRRPWPASCTALLIIWLRKPNAPPAVAANTKAVSGH